MLQVVWFSCHWAHCWRLEVDLYASLIHSDSICVSVCRRFQFISSSFARGHFSHRFSLVPTAPFPLLFFFFPSQMSLDMLLHLLEFEPAEDSFEHKRVNTLMHIIEHRTIFVLTHTTHIEKNEMRCKKVAHKTYFKNEAEHKQSKTTLNRPHMDGNIEEHRWHLRQKLNNAFGKCWRYVNRMMSDNCGRRLCYQMMMTTAA